MARGLVTVFGGSPKWDAMWCSAWHAPGWQVRVAVRRQPGSGAVFKTAGDVGQVTPVVANIRDDRSVAAAIAKAMR